MRRKKRLFIVSAFILMVVFLFNPLSSYVLASPTDARLTLTINGEYAPGYTVSWGGMEAADEGSGAYTGPAADGSISVTVSDGGGVLWSGSVSFSGNAATLEIFDIYGTYQTAPSENWAAVAGTAAAGTDYTVDGSGMTISIHTNTGLAWLAANFAGYTGYNFLLTADLNLSGKVWTPIGTSVAPFSDIFDGQGHTITGLFVYQSSGGVGLFGYVNSGGIVRNVGVNGGFVYGGFAGSIAGVNSGSISNCYATARIGAPIGGQAGGIVGMLVGTVSNCCFYGIAPWGIAGNAGGTVTSSFYRSAYAPAGQSGTPDADDKVTRFDNNQYVILQAGTADFTAAYALEEGALANTNFSHWTSNEQGPVFLTGTFTATVNFQLDGTATGINIIYGTGAALTLRGALGNSSMTGSAGVYTASVVPDKYYIYVNGVQVGTYSLNSATPSVTIKYYSVSLTNGTGISNTSGGGVYLPGSTITLSATVINGYSWNGWTWTIGGASYVSENSTSLTVNSKIALTANAAPITYTITYDLAGGSLTPSNANPSSYNITNSSITLVNPSRTDYIFQGWTGTGLSSPSTSVTIPAGSTGNRSYTANWLPSISGLPTTFTMYETDQVTWDPKPAGGTWNWDSNFFSAAFNSPATFTALKAGTSVITYTVEGVTWSVAVTVQTEISPSTGEDFTLVWWIGSIVISILIILLTILFGRKSRQNTSN